MFAYIEYLYLQSHTQMQVPKYVVNVLHIVNLLLCFTIVYALICDYLFTLIVLTLICRHNGTIIMRT